MATSETAVVRVQQIETTGMRIVVHDRDYIIPFADYPVFEDASPEAIFNVQFFPPDHLQWPDLDVDIALDALEHPERYPLYFDHKQWEHDHPGR